MAGQAIFTLARKGDSEGVAQALRLKVDPNKPDVLGIRPLTYAVGSLGAKIKEFLPQIQKEEEDKTGN